MSPFLMIGRKRKIALAAYIVLLLAIMAGVKYGFLGSYLPVEFWQIAEIYLAASVVASLVRVFSINSYRKRHSLPVGERDNFVLGIDSLTNLVVVFFTIVGALVVFRVPFQTFLTSISLVAVALVLIFRDYISNYLDSFRLMFSTDFKIGNYIRVGENTRGSISDISFRATKLKTDEGDVLFIPNTRLITSEVVNYSKVKFKRIIVPFSLPTDTVHPVEKLDTILKEHLLTAFPDLIQEKKIFLRILNIKEWHTDFALEVSVDQYNFSIEDKVVKAVYTCVLEYQANTDPIAVSPSPLQQRQAVMDDN